MTCREHLVCVMKYFDPSRDVPSKRSIKEALIEQHLQIPARKKSAFGVIAKRKE